ncbi:MAG: hypothetical protein FK733_08975 [Asgard group archaeon]|nr:hypothetical protein [Asgard group archaeon]
MTLVTNVCLNHQSHFGVVWTSDTPGEYRVEVCDATNHRRFSFIGGLKKPYMMAWLDEKTNFKHIRIRLENENRKRKVTEPISKRTLQKFMSDWEFVVNANYHPEFFFVLSWREAGLNYENLPKLQKVNDYSINTILDNLVLEEDPFYPEPLFEDDDFEIRFKKQKEEAKIRYDACINCQKISRDKENEFYTGLESLLQTPHIEQKWLVVIALHYYLRNQINDTEAFYDFVYNGLLNNYYLIRKETFEMLKTHILVQPESAFIIIEKLLNEKNINLKLFGISLLQDYSRFMNGIVSKDLYLRNPYPVKLNKSIAERLIPLYNLSFEIQDSVISHFQKMKQYKNLSTYDDEQFDYFYNADEPAHEKVNNLNLLLRPLTKLKEPFVKYEHK